MSKQPPNNNDNQFDAEFQAIENAMNTMMQGAFSMMFKQFTDSGVFENLETAFPGVINNGGFINTTVYNNGNMTNNVYSEEEEFGGNDFKRLAKKSKEQRQVTSPTNNSLIMPGGQSTEQQRAHTSLIFNLLFQPPPAAMFNRDNQRHLTLFDSESNKKNDGGWSFTSTSQRVIYNPDGTQETVITKKANGVTETIKQIRYPDGRTEEITEHKNSLWNRIFGGGFTNKN